MSLVLEKTTSGRGIPDHFRRWQLQAKREKFLVALSKLLYSFRTKMGLLDEFEKFDQNKSWDQVYQKIKAEDALRNCDVSLKDARRPDFKSRNRYRDVSPYDHSRIQLHRDDIDYINASLVEAPEANRSYILTQGPLQHTSGHFWLMVWEQNSKAVLMLNRVIERGRVKCYKYFPSDDGDDEMEMTFSDVGLKVSYISESETKNYTIRTLQITDLRSGDKKQVLQFHYTTWPDFAVPTSPAAFLNFLMAVRESGALSPDVGPPVIHCSAGIGRSGTFCLVDTCLVLIKQAGTVEGLDVIQVLMDMRQYRMGLIQTYDQLRFSYLAIIEGAKKILSSNPDTPFLDSDNEMAFEEKDYHGAPTPAFNTVAEEYANGYIDDFPRSPPPPPPRMTPIHPEYIRQNHISVLSKDQDDINDEEEEQRRKQGVEIRRRNRDERKKNTAEQIKRMKEKQKECEYIKEKKTNWTPYLIGISLTLVVGGLLFCKMHYG